MLEAIRKYPIATSMVIPGCNDGSFHYRGGIGGVCDRDGQCRLGMSLYRECSNHSLLQGQGLVYSSDDNKCMTLAGHNHMYTTFEDFSHDTVIVGYG